MTWIQNYKAPLKFNNEKTNHLIAIYIYILYPYDNRLLTWKVKTVCCLYNPAQQKKNPDGIILGRCLGKGELSGIPGQSTVSCT